jgi:predicted enzyme related to lactoylglutathione lyase
MKNLISWVSIPSIDFDRAVKFYSELTGKTLNAMGEGDQRMATSVPNTDEWKMVVGFGVTGDSTIKPGSSGLRVYIVSDDLDGWLSRVENAGGKILTPKSEMGEYGFWALIEDTEGNHIGLHSFK